MPWPDGVDGVVAPVTENGRPGWRWTPQYGEPGPVHFHDGSEESSMAAFAAARNDGLKRLVR